MQLTLKDMRIREIVPEDRSDVIRLLEATGVFQNYEIEVADEVIQASIDPASGYHSYIIVNEEDRAVAYVCWGPTPCTSGTFDLYWIAVHPDYQKNGLGRQLINFVEEDIRPKGARLLLIETSSYSDYEHARKFYASSGYKQLAVIQDYYRQGDHKIVYGKNFV